MLITAIALFALAAIFGLVALTAILKNKPTPKPAVFIHGGVAAIALLLVILAVAKSAGPSPIASLVLFIVAALGGFALFAIDMQKKPVPKLLALVHPLVAAIALVLLILFVFNG